MDLEVISRPETDDQFEVISRPERPTGTKFPVESGSEAMQLGTELAAKREESRGALEDELSQILGASYDPTQSFDESYWRQIDIARSSNASDKQKKFLESFPEGDLVEVGTQASGPVILARRDKTEPYRELPFWPRVVAAVASEPVVGGTVGSVVPIGGTILGTIGGLAAKEGIEEARGYGSDDFSWLDALKEGGIAGAVDAVTRGMTRIALGPKLPKQSAIDLGEAVKGASELGLEPIAVGQVGGPFKRGMYRQVGVTSPRVERKISAEERSLLESFKRLGEDFPAGATDDALRDLVRAQQKELENLITLPPGTRADAGQALQEGMQTYERASRRYVNRLYDKAIAESDDVVFNLRPAQETAQSIKAGVRSKAATEGEAVRVSQTPSGELERVVDDIMEIDPTVAKFAAEGEEWTAFEQIKALRTRLFDLKHSDDGAVRREATRLYKALTGVMDNPISGNPNFVEAYKKASSVNWLRENTLEKSFVGRLLSTDTPEASVRRYFQPGHSTELATIRDLVKPRGKWDEFREAFQLDLVNAPTAQQGINRMRNFQSLDPEGWKLLVDTGEAKGIAEFLVRRAQFESSPARSVIEKNMTDAEKLIGLARKSTAGDVADYVKLAGGRDSNMAKTLRAAVYKDILDTATELTPQGTSVMDANKIVSAIQGWKKSGKLDSLFNTNEWKRLENYQRYAAILGETADIGGGMMAGGLRQKTIHAVTDPIMGSGTMWGDVKKIGRNVIRPLVSNDITAWVLSRPASYEMLLRSSGKRPPIVPMAVALTVAKEQYE